VGFVLLRLRDCLGITDEFGAAGCTSIYEFLDANGEGKQVIRRANKLRLHPMPLVRAWSCVGHSDACGELPGAPGGCDPESETLLGLLPAAEKLSGVAARFPQLGNLREKGTEVSASDRAFSLSSEAAARNGDTKFEKIAGSNVVLLVRLEAQTERSRHDGVARERSVAASAWAAKKLEKK